MKNKKIFDVTSSEKHDVILIGKYNIILMLIDCNIKLLNDNQNVYKVYYSILNKDVNGLLKDYNAYKEFNDINNAIEYYNDLKLKLYDYSEEDVVGVLNR